MDASNLASLLRRLCDSYPSDLSGPDHELVIATPTERRCMTALLGALPLATDAIERVRGGVDKQAAYLLTAFGLRTAIYAVRFERPEFLDVAAWCFLLDLDHLDYADLRPRFRCLLACGNELGRGRETAELLLRISSLAAGRRRTAIQYLIQTDEPFVAPTFDRWRTRGSGLTFRFQT